MKKFRNIVLSLIILFIAYWLSNQSFEFETPLFNKKIKRNELYYTQGLLFDTSHTVIESGGMWGNSVIVRMEYPSMKIIKKIDLKKEYFGEGVAKCGDYIYQLTWQNRVILKYSYPELDLIENLDLDSQIKEGWGLASYNNNLYATDGSNKIFKLDCSTLRVSSFIEIFHDNKPLNYLNAFDIVDGFAYSNVYYDPNIYKIDLDTGKVIKKYQFEQLIGTEIESKTLTMSRYREGEVLNGVAWNPEHKHFLITGKMWGHYYEVHLN